MQESILIVEDEEIAAARLKEYLEAEGFIVSVAETVIEAMQHLREKEFSTVILDLNLPDYDGYKVCGQIRAFSTMPIIVTSAYSDLEHKEKAFNLEVDDYLCKPYSMRELVMRIFACLRRYRSTPQKPLDSNSAFQIDTINNFILFKNAALGLTTVEFEILRFLLHRKNSVVTREQLKILLGIE